MIIFYLSQGNPDSALPTISGFNIRSNYYIHLFHTVEIVNCNNFPTANAVKTPQELASQDEPPCSIYSTPRAFAGPTSLSQKRGMMMKPLMNTQRP